MKAFGEARQSISRYLAFYNARRPYLTLTGRTPDQASFNLCRSAHEPNPGDAASGAEVLSTDCGHLSLRLRCANCFVVGEAKALRSKEKQTAVPVALPRAASMQKEGRQGLYGLGAEPVQGFLAGMSAVGACNGR
jgi:hypothetical protein